MALPAWFRLERPFRWLARPAALAILILLVALCLAARPWVQGDVSRVPVEQTAHQSPSSKRVGDLALYRRIDDRVARGESYYSAATTEQRSSRYPLRPFFTVREPLLAWTYAAIGESGLALLAGLLVVGNAVGLATALGKGRERITVGTSVLIGSVSLIDPNFRLLHEFWAGLLLSLAIALYRPHRWWPSALLVLVAMLVREIALPFAVLWLCMAAVDRRWSVVAGIGAALAFFTVAYTFHALQVLELTRPTDIASMGWAAFAGPTPFAVGIEKLTLLTMGAGWLAGPITILALFGFIARGGPVKWFAALWIAGILAGMAMFARPDNWYWAALTLPLLFGGLALAPLGLVDLLVAISRGSSNNFVR